MTKHETMVVDLEAGLDGVYRTTVVPLPVKSSRSWIWKMLALIVYLVFCALASLFFAWHMMKQDNKEIPILSGERISTPSEHGKVLQQIAERTKAAIHLHGEWNDSPQVLKWVSGVDQSFEQGGLKLEDNEIHIPADGLYFVYSQVSYAVRCKADENNDEGQKYLSHSIWRYSDAMGQEMPLQNSANSACQSGEDGKTAYSTVYLGAVFKLLEGDRLSTKTTHVRDIDEDYAKTFFGVFAL